MSGGDFGLCLVLKASLRHPCGQIFQPFAQAGIVESAAGSRLLAVGCGVGEKLTGMAVKDKAGSKTAEAADFFVWIMYFFLILALRQLKLQ